MKWILIVLLIPFGLNAQTEIYNGVSDEFSGWVGTFDSPNCSCIVSYSSQDSTLVADFGTSASNTPGSIVKMLSGTESFAGLSSYTIEFEYIDAGWGTGIFGDMIVYYSTDSLNWTQIGGAIDTPIGDTTYRFNGFNNQGLIGDDIYLKIRFAGDITHDTRISKINVIDNSLTSLVQENDIESVNVYTLEKSIFLTSDISMNVDVTVYNMSGKIVSSDTINLSHYISEIDLYDVHTGMYLVTVSDGKFVTTKKIHLK